MSGKSGVLPYKHAFLKRNFNWVLCKCHLSEASDHPGTPSPTSLIYISPWHSLPSNIPSHLLFLFLSPSTRMKASCGKEFLFSLFNAVSPVPTIVYSLLQVLNKHLSAEWKPGINFLKSNLRFSLTYFLPYLTCLHSIQCSPLLLYIYWCVPVLTVIKSCKLRNCFGLF